MTDVSEPDPSEPAPAPQPEKPSRLSRFRRRGPGGLVSIQSKLIVVLVLYTIVAAVVVGVVAFQAGRTSIRSSVFDRLTEIRESQSQALERQLTDLKNSLIIYTHGANLAGAVDEFTAGFDELADSAIDPAQSRSIVDYYERFSAATEQNSGMPVDADALLPTSNAQRYLQANYTSRHKDGDSALIMADAGDGSAWSAANVRYQGFFAEIVNRFEFEDALLLDTRGNVVYCADKNVDLGTNILTGPFRGSNLRGAYEKALSSNSADNVTFTDFELYQPAGNRPTAWMVSPVAPGGRTVGVLALQFPISKINRLMTFDEQWAQAGLGETGETILVGPDGLMRSDSRLFVEDPQRYVAAVTEAGTPPDVAEAAVRLGGTTLVQPAGEEANRAAQKGQSGTMITTDYLGQEALQAYTPVSVKGAGLHWSLVAEIDTAEAFEGEASFTRTMVVSTTGIVVVACLLSIFLAPFFVRPIRRLEAGARRISAGDYDVVIPVDTRDEVGDLTEAFNEMSRSLTIKEQLLDAQRSAYEKLLNSLMPENVAERFQQGEQTITQQRQNVSVIFADIIGLDRLQAELPAEESLSLINELVRQIDAAAEDFGMERVHTVRNGYLASCGLTVPRLDNARRTVDFALECERIVDRFSRETGNSLSVRAGIDAGPVSSGLVGRSTVVYDLWGSAVNIAHQVKGETPQSGQPGIFVTDRVRKSLNDTGAFTAAGSITVDGEEQPVWQLAGRGR
ncbi:HAMP domain-containing protein [Mycobacterium sp. Y57]|uniref:adenylate/guanylate cyclase domain-containing protein n=1 Tax=Mycolicibacterium xanthum TaxID=2796469 RepID=UPI001C849879|nr:adenylate/guanylate cyclase domain-containing protein [Mycolicibacterium xanthum]MBX7431357.1 HAMP domain-containing protein [Mycolicibacterium xanthum]